VLVDGLPLLKSAAAQLIAVQLKIEFGAPIA
jgi:hypothetical protein